MLERLPHAIKSIAASRGLDLDLDGCHCGGGCTDCREKAEQQAAAATAAADSQFIEDLVGRKILDLDAAIRQREEIVALASELNLVGQVGFKSLGSGLAEEDEELASLKAERSRLCSRLCDECSADPAWAAGVRYCQTICRGGSCCEV
jgi:hypothetical protein